MGNSYDDQVINVGAWTVGTSDFNAYETAQDGTLIFPPGEGLLSSPGTLNTLDILANGVVFHDWNDGVTSEGTFGTSFATPRVAGQMVNSFYNMNPDYVDFIRDNLTHDQAFQIWLDFMPTKSLTTLLDNMVVMTSKRTCLRSILRITETIRLFTPI